MPIQATSHNSLSAPQGNSLSNTSQALPLGTNRFKVNSESAFANKVDIYPQGASTATYYIDESMRLLKGRISDFLDEPSVTWPGKILDRIFGWGQKKNNEDAQTKLFTKNLIAQVDALNKNKSTAHNSADKKRWQDDIYGVEHTYNCTVEDVTYRQHCELITNSDVLKADSDNPDLYAKLAPLCLEDVAEKYYSDVDASPSAQLCSLVKGEQFEFNFRQLGIVFAFYDDSGEPHYHSYYFENVSAITIPEESVTRCYTENLEQDTAAQLDFGTTYNKDSRLCATGYIRIPYGNAYYARRAMMQTFELIPPYIDDATIESSFGGTFLNDYCTCIMGNIQRRFETAQENAPLSTQPHTDILSFKYALGADGSFTIYSPEGMLDIELNGTISDESITQCYDESQRSYSRKRTLYTYINTSLTAFGIAAVSVYAFVQYLNYKKRIREIEAGEV